jgi:3-deoxy-D-arabino-heptulosonate 7-phosphate (DAHP) synthase class II
MEQEPLSQRVATDSSFEVNLSRGNRGRHQVSQMPACCKLHLEGMVMMKAAFVQCAHVVDGQRLSHVFTFGTESVSRKQEFLVHTVQHEHRRVLVASIPGKCHLIDVGHTSRSAERKIERISPYIHVCTCASSNGCKNARHHEDFTIRVRCRGGAVSAKTSVKCGVRDLTTKSSLLACLKSALHPHRHHGFLRLLARPAGKHRGHPQRPRPIQPRGHLDLPGICRPAVREPDL